MQTELPEQILIKQLALVDALFEPLRDPSAKYWAPVHVLRRRYHEGGLPWRAGGSKDHQLALDEMVKCGLIARRKGTGGAKTVAVRLTDSGFVASWAFLGVEANTPLVVLGEVIRLGGSKHWVPETSFNDGRGWGDGCEGELRLVATFHRPALAVGWIESHVDTQRHVGYRATPRGLKVHRNPPALFAEAAGPPEEPDEATLQAYIQAYQEALGWLNAQTDVSVGERSEIGPIPLNACVWHDHSA
jgi:hypothetical protein